MYSVGDITNQGLGNVDHAHATFQYPPFVLLHGLRSCRSEQGCHIIVDGGRSSLDCTTDCRYVIVQIEYNYKYNFVEEIAISSYASLVERLSTLDQSPSLFAHFGSSWA